MPETLKGTSCLVQIRSRWLAHERWNTDDCTWTNWAFADGTRVLQNARQAITFLGVTVQYRF